MYIFHHVSRTIFVHCITTSTEHTILKHVCNPLKHKTISAQRIETSPLRMYDRKNWKYCHIFELGIFGYQHMRVIQNWEKKMGSPCLIFYQTTIKIHCFFTKSLKINTTSHPVKIHTVNEIFTFTLYKSKKIKLQKVINLQSFF